LNIDLFPLVLYGSIVIIAIVGLLIVSTVLGQKRSDHATQDVYESGVLPTGSPNIRISVPFYLTAILFIIFDLEAVFLFAWAVSIREAGWVGFIEVAIFIVILVAGLVYLWKSGALEWRTSRQRHDRDLVKGPGGVVNIKDGKKIEEEITQDNHHGGGH